jgi:hypothetical protein
MVDQDDISRIANLLIKHYGMGAMSVAVRRTEELWQQGDLQAGHDWLQITNAVRDRLGEPEAG